MTDPAQAPLEGAKRRRGPLIAVVVLVVALAVFAVLLVTWRAERRSRAAEPLLSDAGAQVEQARPAEPALVAAPRAGIGSIDTRGLVVDASGAPVVGVAVSAQLELGPGVDAIALPGFASLPVVVAVTAADGHFTLRGLEAGRHRIEVAGPGVFTSEVRFVEVPSPLLSLIVARVVLVRGVVTDQGAAVADAEVSLFGADGVRRTRSNQSGQFRFDRLAEGIYRARATAGERAVPAQRIERLGVGPFDAVELVMGPASILRGRVVDESGEGLIAAVRLSATAGQEPPHYARSEAGGWFVVEGLVAARWTAEAFAPGYVAQEVITFAAGGSFTPVITLHAGAVMSGRVLTSDGVPVSDAAVSVLGEGQVVVTAESRLENELRFRGRPRAHRGARFVPRGELGVLLGPIPFPPPRGAASVRVTEILADSADGGTADAEPWKLSPGLETSFVTDQDGGFQVGGLTPGSYRVLAAHRDFADARSVKVELRRGAARRGLTVVMHRGVMVSGTVRDETGAVIVGATVIADFAGDERARMQGVSGPDGFYSLGPIAAQVTLRATAVAHGDASKKLEPRLERARSERRVNFVLARANAVIAGRVSDASGFPVRGATVTVPVRDRSGNPRSANTDKTGRFEITGLAAGAYLLDLRHAAFPPSEQKVRTGEVLDLHLAFGGGIDVEITDAHSRAAIAGALLIARGPGGRELRASSAEDGACKLVPLRPGAWQLTITAPGYAAVRRRLKVPAGDRPAALTVRDLRISLARGAVLAGIVRDDDGERIAGARVTAGEVTALSDEHGGFRLEEVASGRVELRAQKGQREGGEGMELSPGDERVTLELTIR